MHSEKEIKSALEYIKSHNDFLDYNQTIFDISEGDLLSKVTDELTRQFTGSSAKNATMRACPINIFNKVRDKLSKLYMQEPKRRVLNGNEVDQKLVDYYSPYVNEPYQCNNENYNSYKVASMEIFENTEEGRIDFRPMPGQSFLVRSNSKINPMRPTEFYKIMGRDPDSGKQIYWLYDRERFTPVTDDGKIYNPDVGDTDFLNTYGVLPFNYVSRSKYLLVPKPDLDVRQMSILIPVLITDQNFGSMFLSHPILYGINLNDENLKISPDNFWNMTPGKDPDTTPQIGVLKAEPDLDAMMQNVINQLSMWLDSRNIKPGSIGKLTAENFASGVSKVISEMDTIEDTRKQAIVFAQSERLFWKRLAVIHNYLAPSGRIEPRAQFSETFKLEVMVDYQEEPIFESRADKVNRLKTEVDAKLLSRRRAIKQLNPKYDDKEIDEIINEIKEESNGMAKSEDTDTERFQPRGEEGDS